MNVYSLAIEELNGKTVRLLVTDDGRALCVPGTYGLGPSRVDATGLRFTGDRLEGPIRLTVEPDAWFPPDREPLSCQLELDARLHDGRVTGTAGSCRVSGTVAVEDPLPDPAHWVLTIEQVAPDWPPHMGRGELVVAAGECLLRSPVAHAWVGRVEHANLNLTGGRVQVVVGMQPGGTDLGSERIACELDMTVIHRTIAGCCTVSGEDGQPQRRGLRGRIVAGHPARARPVVAAGPATLAIDVRSLRAPRSVRPWRSLDFSDVRHGRFAGLADLDGDGMAEILSASASQPLGIAGLLAMRLDGTRLWQWGEIGVGCPPGDPAVQTADLDGDGREEIYVAAPGAMVVIEAASGRELRRWPLPADLPWSDCIIVANLRGLARPGDLLIKDRHGMCYAFTASGEPLWRWQDPAGRSIAHHPLIVDVDRDGRDEVLIGWTLLRSDGTPLWDLKSDLCDFRNGHLDSAAVVKAGAAPAETLIAVCYDEANGLSLVNGAGQTQWEVGGSHFHTLCAGPMLPGVGGSQVLCTLARLKHWCWRAWLMHLDGRLAAEYLGLYLPAAMDWDGDGHLELIGGSGIVLRATGEPLANLVDEQGRELGVSSPDVIGHRPYLCDLDGDGQSELLLLDARGILRIYRSPDVSPLPGRHRIGTWNHTDYECPAVPPPRQWNAATAKHEAAP